jgi:hypothetical protein
VIDFEAEYRRQAARRHRTFRQRMAVAGWILFLSLLLVLVIHAMQYAVRPAKAQEMSLDGVSLWYELGAHASSDFGSFRMADDDGSDICGTPQEVEEFLSDPVEGYGELQVDVIPAFQGPGGSVLFELYRSEAKRTRGTWTLVYSYLPTVGQPFMCMPFAGSWGIIDGTRPPRTMGELGLLVGSSEL